MGRLAADWPTIPCTRSRPRKQATGRRRWVSLWPWRRGSSRPRRARRRRCSSARIFARARRALFMGRGLPRMDSALAGSSSLARPMRQPCCGRWKRRSRAARWRSWSAKCGIRRAIMASPLRAVCCLRQGRAARRPCLFMAALLGGPAPFPAPPKRVSRSRRLPADLLSRRAGGWTCRVCPPLRRGC
jgi:hypothetical protein